MKKLFWAGVLLEVSVMGYLGWSWAAATERGWAPKAKTTRGKR